MQILHLDSSILSDHSVTRALSAAVAARLQSRHPSARVVYRDLAAQEVRHLTGPIAAGFRPISGPQPDADALHEHEVSERLLAEFLASEVVVIGAPMYNFSVPSQLKAWMDRIAQAGRTFKYTEQGPVGLAGNKRVIVASARGGYYGQGGLAGMDFQEAYLKAYFGFLGIRDVRFASAEGMSRGEAARERGIHQAHTAIEAAVP